MKEWLKNVIQNKRNFTCVYNKTSNTIYSVPQTKSAVIHVLFTLFTSILFLAAAAGIKTLAHNGLEAMISGDSFPGWAIFLESLAGALALVILFLSIAPRFGMFPGINGFKLKLDEKSAMDKKLGKLIQNNPKALNIDWMKHWHEATTKDQEKMYGVMKDSLSTKSKKSSSKKKNQQVG